MNSNKIFRSSWWLIIATLLSLTSVFSMNLIASAQGEPLPITDPAGPPSEPVYCVSDNWSGKYIEEVDALDPLCPALFYAVEHKYIFGADVADEDYVLAKLNQTVRRAEMSAIAARILSETGGVDTETWEFSDGNLGFIDLPPDLSGDEYWYRDYLKMTSPEIFKGNKGKFLPGSDVLTGEVMKIIFGTFAQAEVLTDGAVREQIAPEAWFSPYFERANLCNVSLAIQEAGYAPTRGEIVKFIYELSQNDCISS